MTDQQPLLAFAEDMRRLRRECPWKREQTHRSLARYLREETAETLEAIDGDDEAHLCEELGDLLLQVYFHAVIAEESGAFTLDDVARGIREKMHRRNPHVFGATAPTTMTAAEVDAQWQAIKAEERRAGVTGFRDGR
jgi:XTP/dITP diphosphohydrolase